MAIGGYFLYTYYEKPKQIAEQEVFHNISLRAIDSPSSKQIEANYTILVNGSFYNGMTGKYGYVLQRIPVNKTFQIYVKAPNHYTWFSQPYFNPSVPLNVRSESILLPIGNVSISSYNNINNLQEPIYVTLQARGLVRNLKVCVRWSNNVVSVILNNQTLSETPKRYVSKVNKCYDLNATLRNAEAMTLRVDYKLYKSVTPVDTINLIFMYGDITPTSNGLYVYEDERGKPIGKEDFNVVLTSREANN